MPDRRQGSSKFVEDIILNMLKINTPYATKMASSKKKKNTRILTIVSW